MMLSMQTNSTRRRIDVDTSRASPGRLGFPCLIVAIKSLVVLQIWAWCLGAMAEDAGQVPNRRDFAKGHLQESFNPAQILEGIFPGTTEQEEKLEAIEIPMAIEQRLGSTAASAFIAEIERQGIRCRDRGRDVIYLQALVDTVRPRMKNKDRYRSIKVYVADSNHTDARSFPGGTLIFCRGLLEFAESEAAIVGIVGHELSHIDHGHQLRPIQRMKLFEQQMHESSQDLSYSRMMLAVGTMTSGFARPFRPEDESQADADGATWAHRAGYDPREMARLFMKLHKRDGRQDVIGLSFFRTHPFHIDRFHAIDAV